MNEQDKELLELAAKAAGLKVRWVDQFDCGLTDTYLAPLEPASQHFIIDKFPYKKWDPLKKDGNALRLAVKLKIDICTGPRTVLTECAPHKATESLKPDAYAATRRAIVRTAAEIGKTLP